MAISMKNIFAIIIPFLLLISCSSREKFDSVTEIINLAGSDWLAILDDNPEYAGVKAIIVNAEGNSIKVDTTGNIAEEGTIPQYVINKPSLVNGVFTVKGEAPISEVASASGVDAETAQEARQKEYRTLYNIRQALQVNPNQKIYLDINTSAGASVTFDSGNPVKLSEIDFKSFGEEFVYEVDPATGRAYFTVSFSNKLIRIDRPGIIDVIPAETLAKYLFDTSVPYQTKKEIFESLLFTKDIRVRENAILYKGQPITEEALAQVLKSVTESASGVVTSTYRANVPISSNGSVDIPYYDQNSLKYNTLSTTDYMLKYFNTTARLEETTKPYFNLSFDPALQLELQSATESSSKSVNSKAADIERRRQEELDKAFDNNKQTLEDQIDKVIKDKGWNIDNVLFHGGPKFDKFAKQFFQTGEYSDLDMRRIAESMGVRIPEGNFSFSVIPITALRYALKYGKNNPTIYIVNKTKSLGAKEITGNEEIEAQEWIIDADNISDVITVPLIPDANKINAKYDAELAALKQQPTSTTQPSTSVKREYTPENITTLKPNEVFVFGSNAEGVHGKGAALLAKQKFGAVEGKAKGRQGQSYAIITKKNWKVEKSSTLDEIYQNVIDFNDHAKMYEENKFYVTKIGSSLAGYTIEEIKQIWKDIQENYIIPDNVVLPKEYEVRTSTQPSTSVELGVEEQKVPETSNSAKPISFQLDLASIGEAVANELKESIVNQGLGATFNIQESVDSKIAENINKGKQNSCK
jgi:hypothetical protein